MLIVFYAVFFRKKVKFFLTDEKIEKVLTKNGE